MENKMMISEDEMAADDVWIGIDRMGTYLVGDWLGIIME